MGRPTLKCENGDCFGMFEVIDNTPIVKQGHAYVKVKCTYCGHEEYKAISDLKRRNSTGCKHCMGLRKTIPINIGDIFGNWTVNSVPLSGIHKNNVVYECVCTCGNKAYVSSYDLRTGKSKECKQCSTKRTGEKVKKQNGMIGSLSTNQFHKLERSAKSRNIPFDVTISYLWECYENQKGICAITGDQFSSFSEASLDRIDSTKGYVKGNVQWVTKQANLSKHIMSMDELYEFCKKVLNHANQQLSYDLNGLRKFRD